MTEIYNRYGISPTYLYKLRDRALEALLFNHSPSL